MSQLDLDPSAINSQVRNAKKSKTRLEEQHEGESACKRLLLRSPRSRAHCLVPRGGFSAEASSVTLDVSGRDGHVAAVVLVVAEFSLRLVRAKGLELHVIWMSLRDFRCCVGCNTNPGGLCRVSRRLHARLEGLSHLARVPHGVGLVATVARNVTVAVARGRLVAAARLDTSRCDTASASRLTLAARSRHSTIGGGAEAGIGGTTAHGGNRSCSLRQSRE
mmetsp:Transcript_31709/g.67973  ORF Transcript_31709/g.67973 Transcript_31709/m.67973 type:complete len:220 (-) Transcript_31709:40-699(-)